MKVAITADPGIPVPPLYYGGVERIIDLLITELLARGHEITLFAHKDSVVSCKLVAYPTAGNALPDALRNTWTINKILFTHQFDLIHSFGRLAYLFPVLPASIPKLMSYQREPTIRQIVKASRISRKRTLAFTGCSDYITNQIKPFAETYTVHNAVDVNKYKAAKTVSKDAPLIFLGRVEAIKGVHIAIEAALKTGKTLKIAGNIPPESKKYFDLQIKPFLGKQVEYIGPVDDRQKADLLEKGLALLMPICWNEPFGIVMIEAMAAGTPVIGFGRGAVPEVIVQGQNGFIANTIDEFIGYIKLIPGIDRTIVRKIVEERFAAGVICDQYLDIYQNLLNRAQRG